MSSSYESWNNVYYILLVTPIGGIFKNKANEVYGIRPVLKTNNLEREKFPFKTSKTPT